MSQDSKNENKTCTPESETAEAVRDEAVENAQAEANAEAEQTAQDAEAEKASGKKDPKDAKIEELERETSLKRFSQCLTTSREVWQLCRRTRRVHPLPKA